jgi:hypothetical protein
MTPLSHGWTRTGRGTGRPEGGGERSTGQNSGSETVGSLPLERQDEKIFMMISLPFWCGLASVASVIFSNAAAKSSTEAF